MKKILIMLFLSSLLSGFSLTQPVAQQPVDRYLLIGASQLKLQTKTSNNTLLVSQPTASPGYQTNAMVYIKEPYRLATFAVNRWVAPPAQMITPLLVDSLKNTGYFKAVVAAPVAALTNYQLDTTLLTFQQNFINDPSEVTLRIKVELISNKTRTVMASHTFTSNIKTTANTPYAGVIAANKATSQLMQSIAKFVVKQIKVR